MSQSLATNVCFRLNTQAERTQDARWMDTMNIGVQQKTIKMEATTSGENVYCKHAPKVKLYHNKYTYDIGPKLIFSVTSVLMKLHKNAMKYGLEIQFPNFFNKNKINNTEKTFPLVFITIFTRISHSFYLDG